MNRVKSIKAVLSECNRRFSSDSACRIKKIVLTDPVVAVTVFVVVSLLQLPGVLQLVVVISCFVGVFTALVVDVDADADAGVSTVGVDVVDADDSEWTGNNSSTSSTSSTTNNRSHSVGYSFREGNRCIYRLLAHENSID